MKKEREEKGTLFFLIPLLLIVVPRLFFLIHSYIDVAYPKTIKTEAVKNLKAELKEEKIITDMKCYFFRPDLNFEFKVKEDFTEEKLYEILNYLNKYVDSGDLDKVSEKVDWTRFNGINIEVFKPSNDKDYPKYEMNAEYYTDHIGTAVDGYKTWNILRYDYNNEEKGKYEHIDKVKFNEKE